MQLYLHTGQFVSSLPYTTVTGVIGEEIVLPCRVVAEHVPEIFSVQWIFHEQSEKITVSRYDGKSKKEIQDERYQGRTYFFHSEFRAGNMSLHLKDIKNSDKGSYTCLVSFDNHQICVFFSLARGIVPSIFLKNYMKESISLSCHTEGWFPEPRVIWLDSQEQIRREPSTTKIMMMPAGLYSVVTSMNLEPGSDMEVSCRIVNRLLNTTSESRVLISGGSPSREAPITIITVNAPAVLVGGQATLQCWLDDSVHSNTSVLWYKKEEGKNITLCSSSSLGGVVEQHHNDEWNRTEGHWEGRTLVLIIRQVQVADEGTYVCVVRGDNGSQEAAAHLDITRKQGDSPSATRSVMTENMCRYTCKSKGWYPRPKVLWRNYGGKTLDVEANTNITWNEEDLFAIQSNITVPCNDVDVMCVVILPKTKINQTGRSYFYTCIVGGA
uniref:Ig-like domain-containing protein n=1 Tax=Nothoprocta perdicaria TaxID=30464 RepID=A0A8C7A1J4_NOTPE